MHRKCLPVILSPVIDCFHIFIFSVSPQDTILLENVSKVSIVAIVCSCACMFDLFVQFLSL